MTQIFYNISCSVRTPIGSLGFCFLQNTAHGSNIFMHREVLGRHNISLKTFATVNTLTVDLQQQDDGRLRVIIIHSLDA